MKKNSQNEEFCWHIPYITVECTSYSGVTPLSHTQHTCLCMTHLHPHSLTYLTLQLLNNISFLNKNYASDPLGAVPCPLDTLSNFVYLYCMLLSGILLNLVSIKPCGKVIKERYHIAISFIWQSEFPWSLYFKF